MAKKTKKKSTTQKLLSRYGPQAAAEAFLRFNPERSALRAALEDVAGQERQGTSTAKSVFGAVKGATEDQRKFIAKTYGESGTLAKALKDAPTPPSTGGPVSGVAAVESAAADRKRADEQTRATNETADRVGEAASGMAFQISNVKSRAAQDRDKIRARALELDREEGAFTQGRVASLAEAARAREATARQKRLDRAQQDKNREDQQSFTAGENEKNRNAKNKNGSKGPKKDSAAYVDTRDTVNAALRHAKRLKASGRSLAQAVDILVTGRESQTIPSGQTRTNPATGKPQETSLKIPAIPKTKRTFAQIAVELAWTGKISAQSARRLRALGYSVKTLGYHVQSSKKAPPKRGSFADPGVYKTS